MLDSKLTHLSLFATDYSQMLILSTWYLPHTCVHPCKNASTHSCQHTYMCAFMHKCILSIAARICLSTCGYICVSIHYTETTESIIWVLVNNYDLAWKIKGTLLLRVKFPCCLRLLRYIEGTIHTCMWIINTKSSRNIYCGRVHLTGKRFR